MITNDYFNIISVFGTIASILGAILSIKAENKARNSAQIAESAKNQILKKQGTTHLVEILHQTKRIQQIFGKYAITQNESLAGIKTEEDANFLQDYIFFFNENRALIEESTKMEVKSIYESLDEGLDNFTKSSMIIDKKTYGKQIRLICDDIIFKLKKIIDSRNNE